MKEGRGNASAILGLIGCLMVIVHIILALVIVVYPDASRGSKVMTFYRRLVVLGPFFQEPRIVSSPHLLVSFRINGRWLPGKDFGCEEVSASNGSYTAVKHRSFEEFLGARAAGARRGNGRSRAVGELEDYLRSRATDNGADSVAVAFVFQSRSSAHHGIRVDTAFHHHFKP